MNYKLDFQTAYQQFYLSDKESPKKTDSDSFWTSEAHNHRLAIEDGILGIGTACYGHVKGEVNILKNEEAKNDYTKYDHIVEGSIKISSGVMQVLDCPNVNSELEIKLPNGSYRVRIYSSNLRSVVGDDGDDYYRIDIWPDSKIGRAVLKQFDANRLE
ncbi:hypothetical protein GWC95_10375 [Sediminibacterium roseum]|uniref:Uncharacterized protein n=1 Tax=Sediminibacterium roseum TaxID=1978412 RepID=A0ABW9ZT70_9BACT|nr:hypothetical protein [Sediminibacterium roseum]NCI50328.1 hypothetical protein [Sediminibacterium roseum]